MAELIPAPGNLINDSIYKQFIIITERKRKNATIVKLFYKYVYCIREESVVRCLHLPFRITQNRRPYVGLNIEQCKYKKKRREKKREARLRCDHRTVVA